MIFCVICLRLNWLQHCYQPKQVLSRWPASANARYFLGWKITSHMTEGRPLPTSLLFQRKSPIADFPCVLTAPTMVFHWVNWYVWHPKQVDGLVIRYLCQMNESPQAQVVVEVSQGIGCQAEMWLKQISCRQFYRWSKKSFCADGVAIWNQLWVV